MTAPTNVPMCRATSNAFSKSAPFLPTKSCQPNNHGTRMRWPLDETGRNSDRPWVTPRTIAWTIGTASHRNCSASADRHQPGCQFVGGQRTAPVISLGEAATETAEDGQLFAGLDTLGHHPQSHGVGQPEHRGEDGAGLLTVL